MSEAYTMADESSKVSVRCPFPDSRRSNCIGKYCMAWIREIGSDGKDTGRGRCGMVGPLHSPSEMTSAQSEIAPTQKAEEKPQITQEGYDRVMNFLYHRMMSGNHRDE